MAIPFLLHERFVLSSLSDAIFSYYIIKLHALKRLLEQSSAEWYFALVLLCFLLWLNVDTTKSKTKCILCLDPSAALNTMLSPHGIGVMSFTLFLLNKSAFYSDTAYSTSLNLLLTFFCTFSPFVFNIFVQSLFANYLTEESHCIFKCLG